ncbi:uncharacterized protein LOC116928727 [Daphnia magna]|uniref:uncharacterized protein LOC116928727 n=1 Tax=Daphnia magna TaxID=35525 RepID=UPI0014021CF6|nr:uncharacterized protein LOC116928727 [Daphnia magna]
MAPEALKFVKDTLTAGAQPAVMSKLLQDKFGTNLISKDLINIKRTLTGKSQDEWADTVAFLQELQKWFRSAVYAALEAEFHEAKSQLQALGKEIAAFFDGNWFNIADK